MDLIEWALEIIIGCVLALIAAIVVTTITECIENKINERKK